MTIETVTHISDLNQSFPASGDDPSEGDDHIRNIKKALATDFANINGAVTATPTILNNIGLIQISTATASSAATVDFTAAFSSTYDEYELHIVNAIPASSGVTASLLTTTDNVTWDVTNYNTGLFTTASGTNPSTTAIPLTVTSAVSNSTNSPGLSAVVKIFSPSGATVNKAFQFQSVCGAGAGSFQVAFGGGLRLTTSAITGLRFLFSSGNVASGLFKLYGVKK